MEKRRRSQLYFKLFWTYTAIALVIVSVLTIYFMYLSKRSVLRQNQEEREHISANAAEYIRETEVVCYPSRGQ